MQYACLPLLKSGEFTLIFEDRESEAAFLKTEGAMPVLTVCEFI
jgi:hypothetical protein